MRGLYINYSDRKMNIITVTGKSVMHRQIERRNGMTYMRLKKRALAC
ncbi:MAG: hypothetical protein KJ709_00345 [Nanoarchaeota archaeon]|nr:hypothetical protein [Nanoarchaeota archaeon]